jgi:hypothetical protein
MPTPYKPREIMDPPMNPGDEPYFEAAAAEKLLIKHCDDCGKVHHYPRAVCPFCLSSNVQWQEAKGTATIYSYSVMRRGTPIPYCVAYVTLDEGVTMMTNVIDCDLDDVRIGQRVRVVFRKTTGGTSVPMFTPAA